VGKNGRTEGRNAGHSIFDFGLWMAEVLFRFAVQTSLCGKLELLMIDY